MDATSENWMLLSGEAETETCSDIDDVTDAVELGDAAVLSVPPATLEDTQALGEVLELAAMERLAAGDAPGTHVAVSTVELEGDCTPAADCVAATLTLEVVSKLAVLHTLVVGEAATVPDTLGQPLEVTDAVVLPSALTPGVKLTGPVEEAETPSMGSAVGVEGNENPVTSPEGDATGEAEVGPEPPKLAAGDGEKSKLGESELTSEGVTRCVPAIELSGVEERALGEPVSVTCAVASERDRVAVSDSDCTAEADSDTVPHEDAGAVALEHSNALLDELGHANTDGCAEEESAPGDTWAESVADGEPVGDTGMATDGVATGAVGDAEPVATAPGA